MLKIWVLNPSTRTCQNTHFFMCMNREYVTKRPDLMGNVPFSTLWPNKGYLGTLKYPVFLYIQMSYRQYVTIGKYSDLETFFLLYKYYFTLLYFFLHEF